MRQRGFERGQEIFRRGDFEQLDFAPVQKFLRGAGVIAVVALSGKDQNRVVGAREPARAPADFFSHAADDLGLGLAGGPGGAFPFAHLGGGDDWN